MPGENPIVKSAAQFKCLPNHRQPDTTVLVPLCRLDNWREVIWILCEARRVTRADGEIIVGIDNSAHDVTVFGTNGVPLTEEEQALRMLADVDLRIIERLSKLPANRPLAMQPPFIYRCKQPDTRTVTPAEAPVVQEEIAAFSAQSIVHPELFTDEALTDDLTDGDMSLVRSVNCIRHTALPDGVPEYLFDIFMKGDPVGRVSMRIGSHPILYYFGHIGYWIYPQRRGEGYAGRACKILANVARRHAMSSLILTHDIKNLSSGSVCTKLGAHYRRSIMLPEENPLRSYGQRIINIYSWNI